MGIAKYIEGGKSLASLLDSMIDQPVQKIKSREKMGIKELIEELQKQIADGHEFDDLHVSIDGFVGECEITGIEYNDKFGVIVVCG